MPTIAETVHSLRTTYGFSIADVEALTGLSATRIVQVESGNPPSVREVSQFGRAFAIDPALIYRGAVKDPNRTVARFRAPQGIQQLDGRDARLLALASECGRIGAELVRLLGRSILVLARRSIRGVAEKPAPWKQGYEMGALARHALAGAQGPLLSLQQFLESAGVHVAYVRFEAPGVEAASVVEPGSMPVVLLNARIERVRNRLSRRAILAHELCHLLHDGGERDLTIVSRDHDESPIEQRANGFAPSFLAPEAWVQLRSKQPVRLVTELAEAWGLTFEGAIWHAKNLGYISPGTAERLHQAKRVRIRAENFEGEITRTPPGQLGIEVEATTFTKGLLSELAMQAAADGLISNTRAEEILGLQ